MYKSMLMLAAVAVSGVVCAQSPDYFEPYQKITLRAPSVPLLVNDPYFSFWSPFDHLYDGTTRHWDDQQKAMDGYLRVDGTLYRFMGGQRAQSIRTILPNGSTESYKAKVRYGTNNQSPANGWEQRTFNDGAWTEQTGPWGDGYPGIVTNWKGDNTDLFIRRHFNLTASEVNGDYWLIFSHDDRYEIFVNGTKVASTMDDKEPSWKQNIRVRLSDVQLYEGDNVIAFHVHNTTGGAQADIGLFRNEFGYHPGYQSIKGAGMADDGAWSAKVRRNTPAAEWKNEDFDDSSWATEKGAFGSKGEYPKVNTVWTDPNSDVYIRRKINLTADDLKKDLVVLYSHDDVCEGYINGRAIFSTGETWVQNVPYKLTDKDKAVLHEGENVIAYHVHNTSGGAMADIGLYVSSANEVLALQKDVDVLATNTYYTFKCGPVDLDLVFTAPFLMDDVELMSTPINYISYRVKSNDGNEHDVQFYFGTTPEISVDNNQQPTTSTIVTEGERKFIKSGSIEQPILQKTGDNITIDWGYLYIPDVNGTISIADAATTLSTFTATGKLPETAGGEIKAYQECDMPMLSYVHDFGKVKEAAQSYMMFGYDEVEDMIYMDKHYKGYWARKGKTIQQAFAEFESKYDDIMTRAKAQDKIIYDDALASGNVKYAEILSLSYRHSIAAHKIFEDEKGNLLFFSKENNSNGCVNTVDLTYPSSPLYLLYNTELMKGMCTSILEYCQSNRWGFNFAAHDLGQYPHANNQVYATRFPEADGGFGGNMPIEESANIVVLAAAISIADGNVDWANKYWKTLTTWTDYLVDNGTDPENQLCTDDFAGHLAHNANLAVKAIMGVAGYGLLCNLRGEQQKYEYYIKKAQEMASKWQDLAKEGDHYKLAYDRSGTWSQKYNIIWDKAWDTNIFPEQVKKSEFNYYKTKLRSTGIALDSRESYTKTDWSYWSASLADTPGDFLRFSDALWNYANGTSSRVPLSDWYWVRDRAEDCNWVNFRARSVIGGHWMKVYVDKTLNGKNQTPATPSTPAQPSTPIRDVHKSSSNADSSWYNLLGQRVERPNNNGIYIHDGEKVAVKQ